MRSKGTRTGWRPARFRHRIRIAALVMVVTTLLVVGAVANE